MISWPTCPRCGRVCDGKPEWRACANGSWHMAATCPVHGQTTRWIKQCAEAVRLAGPKPEPGEPEEDRQGKDVLMPVAFDRDGVTIHVGDALAVLREMPGESVHCCVTSPPYWGLRDYGMAGQIGLEETPDAYVAKLVDVFREVRRVLRSDGTCWVNLGDSYNNFRTQMGPGQALHGRDDLRGKPVPESKRRGFDALKEKDLVGIPWRVAFALQADGWWLRQDIIWHKPNPMPESVTDRCTKAHEYVFLLAKSERYFYDAAAIAEPQEAVSIARVRRAHSGTHAPGQSAHSGLCGPREHGEREDDSAATRNRRSVWTVPTAAFTGWQQTVRWVRVEPDVVSCGMTRTESLDCPLHAGSSAAVSIPSCDEREVDLSIRTERKIRHDSEPTGEHVQTVQPHGQDSSLGSLDSSLPSCVPTAIARNTESRKRGRAPETTPSCTPCERTESHIADMPIQLGSSGQRLDIPGSRPWPDEMDAHSLDRTRHHTVDRSSLPISEKCTCAFYQEETKETTHFATFPEKLIEPCILAGCPPGGVVLDPFLGSGTTAAVARRLGRRCVGIEINPGYAKLAVARFDQSRMF